jgi:16S rRNA (uracil1498-N3)-methyltransferase
MGNDCHGAMTAERRFVLDARKLVTGDVATIRGNELHHLRDVLRLGTGDEIILVDVTGRELQARIDQIARDHATALITGVIKRRKRARIVLAQPIIKGPRMDFVVEKAAELGATELWPLITARTQIQAPGKERINRWRRLAAAAAKQSQTPAVMMIREPINFERLIESVPNESIALICDPAGAAMRRAIGSIPPPCLLICCGPEGGFEPAEREAARRAGLIAVTLGPNRLRSETAAITALGIAASVIDELNRGD